MPARVSPNPTAPNVQPNLTPQEFAQLFRLRPEQAIKFLEGKGIQTTLDWRAMWQDEHARAFTISRLTSPDLLETIQAKLVKSVAGDLSRKDWTRDVRTLLQDSGWWGDIEVIDQATGEVLTTRFNASRLRLIYDVNTRTAQAAGQWERFELTKNSHPYLRYVTKRDEKVREQHRSWHNLVLPVDHPFWNTHAPPNGWRCRCSLTAMSQRDYDKGVSPRGDPLYKSAPKVETRDWFNAKTGKTEKVPVGIDPGWAYNPGKAGMRKEALAKTVEDKLAGLSPGLAQAARKTLARSVAGDPSGFPLIHLAGVDTEYVDGVHEVLTAFSQQNTEGWLPHGVYTVDAIREPDMIAGTDHRGYFALGTAPIAVLDGQSGLQVITTALTKIKQGKPLEFKDEYGIETLWHEILHNSQKYTQPEDMSVKMRRVVEGLHQSLARQSYPTLMTALGTQAVHQDAIRKHGLSYPKATASYYVLFGQLGLLDASGAMLPRTEAALREVMFNTPYAAIKGELAIRLSTLSGGSASEILLLIERIERGKWLE